MFKVEALIQSHKLDGQGMYALGPGSKSPA